MEPRARATRHKTTLNFGPELTLMLTAYGAPAYPPSLPYDLTPVRPPSETLRVLDEILTDFIIETCHEAVTVATYSGRAKLKTSDFEWVLRKDGPKLGHVRTMFEKKRDIDGKKKAFDANAVAAGDQVKIAVGDLATLAEEAGEEGTGKGKGRGRGRRKKRALPGDGDAAGEDEGGGEEPRKSKKARSEIG